MTNTERRELRRNRVVRAVRLLERVGIVDPTLTEVIEVVQCEFLHATHGYVLGGLLGEAATTRRVLELPLDSNGPRRWGCA